ncbi:MAG: ABC transporter substrate-binding protein [Candidatus Thorarchaeota archaeon]
MMWRPIILVMLVLSLGLSSSPQLVSSAIVSSDTSSAGPSVNKLLFELHADQSSLAVALKNGDIDVIGEYLSPAVADTLKDTTNIELSYDLRNGYGYFTINCAKYPYSLTAFRRAFAFAINKTKVCQDCFDGYARPIDSVVPAVNPLSIEGSLPYNYYNANVSYGCHLLEQAGFSDIDSDGFLEAPNGSEIHVSIDIAQSMSMASDLGSIAVEAFTSLGIDAVAHYCDFYDYLNKLYYHQDYDIAFLGTSFNNFALDWLVDYESTHVNDPYFNFPAFTNTSLDHWIDILSTSTDWGAIQPAAIRAQQILVYESPIVVLYENYLVSAHRTDRFQGFQSSSTSEIPNWWSNYYARLLPDKGGPFGGTLRWGITHNFEHFNFMLATYNGDFQDVHILSNMYDSLLRFAPNGTLIPWLAESYTVKTYSDDPSILSGHTKITFNLRKDVLWSDLVPLTAEDVVFTFNYYKTGNNPCRIIVPFTVTTTDSYTVVLDFDTVSYWHIYDVCTKWILPQHKFTGRAWDHWYPDPLNHPMVLSGPFAITDYKAGQYLEMSRNLFYFHGQGILNDKESPQIQYINNLTIYEDATNQSIEWTVSDENPFYYFISDNQTILQSGTWDGSVIKLDLDNLVVGKHNITLIAFDMIGNFATDQVWITVLPGSPPSPDTGLPLLTISVAMGSIGVIAVVAFLVIKHRGT